MTMTLTNPVALALVLFMAGVDAKRTMIKVDSLATDSLLAPADCVPGQAPGDSCLLNGKVCKLSDAAWCNPPLSENPGEKYRVGSKPLCCSKEEFKPVPEPTPAPPVPTPFPPVPTPSPTPSPTPGPMPSLPPAPTPSDSVPADCIPGEPFGDSCLLNGKVCKLSDAAWCNPPLSENPGEKYRVGSKPLCCSKEEFPMPAPAPAPTIFLAAPRKECPQARRADNGKFDKKKCKQAGCVAKFRCEGAGAGADPIPDANGNFPEFDSAHKCAEATGCKGACKKLCVPQ